jgi:hypothetical protein
MPFKEAFFWVSLTVFGTGLYFVFEHKGIALLLIIAGLLGIAYSIYAHHQPNTTRLKIPGPRASVLLFCAATLLDLVLNQLHFMYQLRSNLDTYVVPRTISAWQAEVMRKALQTVDAKDEVTVVSSLTDEEATDYAKQFKDLLIQSGWKATTQDWLNPLWEERPINAQNDGVFDTRNLLKDRGIVIRHGFIRTVRPSTRRDLSVETALVFALKEAGIIFGTDDAKPETIDHPVIIEVGQRPLPVLRQPSLHYRALRWALFWDRQ